MMRRTDRKISDDKKINTIIQKCKVCRIGFFDDGEVYIVPLNFGFVEKDGKRIFYFHGAKSGRKADLIKQNPKVGFELDTDFELWKAENPCDFTAGFRSIVGTGTMCIVENEREKRVALTEIMASMTDKKIWEFDEKMIESVNIFRLDVTKISCKENIR